MTIGTYIRQQRYDQRISQKLLADWTGVSQATISNWESDKTFPDSQEIIRLAQAFSVPLETLLKAVYLPSSSASQPAMTATQQVGIKRWVRKTQNVASLQPCANGLYHVLSRNISARQYDNHLPVKRQAVFVFKTEVVQKLRVGLLKQRSVSNGVGLHPVGQGFGWHIEKDRDTCLPDVGHIIK